MDVEARNKYCGYIMFNTPSAFSKGSGLRNNDLILNAASSSNGSPQTGSTNHSMAASPAAVEEQNVKKENNSFQIYNPSSNNNSISNKLPKNSKMQPEKHPPRPPNAFILYRRAKRPAIIAAHRNLTNAEVSRIISKMWREEPEEERSKWKRYADQMKLEHMKAFPVYVYRPNKNKARKQSAVPMMTPYLLSSPDTSVSHDSSTTKNSMMTPSLLLLPDTSVYHDSSTTKNLHLQHMQVLYNDKLTNLSISDLTPGYT